MYIRLNKYAVLKSFSSACKIPDCISKDAWSNGGQYIAFADVLADVNAAFEGKKKKRKIEIHIKYRIIKEKPWILEDF